MDAIKRITFLSFIPGEHPAAMQKSRVKELYNSKEINFLILLSLLVKQIIFYSKSTFIV